MSGQARLFSLCVLLCSLSVSLPALAQQQVGYSFSKSALLISTKFPNLIDSKGRKKLGNCLPNTVVVRVNTYVTGKRDPVALAAMTCQARLLPMSGDYEVQIRSHIQNKTFRMAKTNQVINYCTTLKRFPVASLSVLGSQKKSVEVIAEFNPVSKKLLKNIRRWISNPQGGHRNLGGGHSFFGSTVSLFVNHRIGRADRTVSFKTHYF